MKTIFTLALLSVFAFTSQAQIRYLKGTLQASQEGPTVSSPGSGVVIVRYNTSTKFLELFGNYRGLTAPIANQHIHQAPPGVSGGIIVPLNSTGGTAGELSGSKVMTAAEETELLAGNTYANIHTATYTNGELRAQLTITSIDQTEFLSARIQGAQQVPPNGTLATGIANAIVDKITHELFITGRYSGLTTAATNAHIHTGAPAISGGVIIPLKFVTATAGSLDTSVVLSATDQADILSGNTYVNIHTSTYTNGEIRGQLTTLNKLRYFAGALTGAKEVPATPSTARGTVIVKYNTETNFLELTGDYQNLTNTINGSHIHGPAGPTGTASVLFPLTNQGGTTGTLTGTATLTELQEADLLAGNMYVNVHSTGTYTDGEIRTQLIGTSPGETEYLTGVLSAGQSVVTPPNPAVVSSGTGTTTILLDRLTRTVYVTASFSGLTSNINNTHIHGGGAGTNGTVVVPLFFGGTTSGTVTGTATVRATFADSIMNGLTYLNIHTVNYGAGEIRAQLGNLVLPVKLELFNGFKDRNQIVLIWQSAQEVNVRNYQVEQQNAETGEWITKATIPATGGASLAKYRFNDNPTIGKKDYILYRLKTNDLTGSAVYSPVIRINHTKSNASLTIMPNPVVNGRLALSITGVSSEQRAEISVIDVSGRVMLKSTVPSTLSINTIDISKLSSGLYRLVVKMNETTLQQSFSKQ